MAFVAVETSRAVPIRNGSDEGNTSRQVFATGTNFATDSDPPAVDIERATQMV